MSKNAIILGVGLADNVSKQLDTMANRLRGKMRNLASVGSELSMGITLPIVAAGAATLKFAGDLDALKKALAATMGSAAAAETEFLKLKEAAKAPGIGLEEAVKGSFLLQGLGASADEARRQMLALAKAVSLSGGGEAQFAGVMQQFTQMKGVGKILGGDVRFMIENAPVLAKVLNNAFGTANPERIRDMGVSVDEFVDKMITGLEDLQGIGGSLKNDMENLWTAIRVGVGEIGLAVLGAGDLREGMASLADKVTDVTGKIRDWVKENPKLTEGILKAFLAMAATGPILRFVGDMGLAVSTVGKLGSALMKIPGLLVNIDKTSKLMSVSAFGWVGIAAAAVWGLVEAITKLDSLMYKDANGNRIVKTDENGRKYTQAFAGRGSGKNYINEITPEARNSAHDLMQQLNPFGAISTMSESDRATLAAASAATQRRKPPLPPGDKGPKGPFLVDMLDNPGTYSTDSDRPDGTKFMEGISGAADYSKTMPLLGIDREALEGLQAAKHIIADFEKEMISARIEQSLGADATKVMGLEVDALANKYRSMAEIYGETSTFAVDALSAWEEANKKFTESQKLQNDELERKNKALEYGRMALDGVASAVSGLVAEGGGFKEFAAGIMKAVSAMAKLAIAEYVAKTIAALGFVGAIPAIVGGGVLAGALDGLLNRVSLAKGGVVKGETMIRAGEYPSAHINPEVISPVNIMQKYIREAVGDMGGGGGTFVIRGDDLVLQTSKAQGRAMRRGSGNVIQF